MSIPIYVSYKGEPRVLSHYWGGKENLTRWHVLRWWADLRPKYFRLKIWMDDKLLVINEKDKLKLKEREKHWAKIYKEHRANEKIIEKRWRKFKKKVLVTKQPELKLKPQKSIHGPTIQDIIIDMFKSGMPLNKDQVLIAIRRNHPNARTTDGNLSWYVTKYNAGELPCQKKPPERKFKFQRRKRLGSTAAKLKAQLRKRKRDLNYKKKYGKKKLVRKKQHGQNDNIN